ncbi:MAG: RNA methyltransferase [Desulfobulbaceae bacterium]|nr:MAG: RNA methyltransferase [Desulfobulbaceae bacterium]
MALPRENFAIILVEPQGGANIGSICRVMMNFGFQDLRLVKPRVDHLGKEARDMAVTAKKSVLRSARKYHDLAEAIADCHLVIGSSRRFGKYRNEFIRPHELAAKCSALPCHQKVALVFGREDHGLTTHELSLCDTFITIETTPELPSLNLAQAVAICLYEYARQPSEGSESADGGVERAVSGHKEQMFDHMRRTLLAAGYLDPGNPDHILRTYRRIFNRAGLDEREVRILHGLWSLIDRQLAAISPGKEKK